MGVVGVGGTGQHREAGGWWGWHLFPRSEVTDSRFWFGVWLLWLLLLWLLFDWVLEVMDHCKYAIHSKAKKEKKGKLFEVVANG